MRAKVLKAFRTLPWVLLALTGSFLYFGHGLKDLVEGRGQKIAREIFRITKGVDEVRIYRLEGSPQQKTDEAFRVRGYHTRDIDVFGSIPVSFQDWDEFMKCWSGITLTEGGGGMCHEAPYGFRLYRDGNLVSETSICWHCENFTVQVFGPFRARPYGFDPKSEAAQKLLSFCDARLPYYRPPPNPEKGS